ncbi:MAG: hypothetical protein EBT38_04005, partial [Acidimicrobiia bacterium]|nr:hypothetical protein [Acidimicrobiia bacterium]
YASGDTKLSFDLGPIAVQPAEIMKPVMVLVLAAWFAEAGTKALPYDEFVRALVLAGIPFALIFFQPDLGSAMTLAAGVLGVLIIAGTQRRHFIGVTIMGIATFAASIWSGLVRDYQLERFTALWNQNNTSDTGLQNLVLQVRYAKRAVAAGGYFGKRSCWLHCRHQPVRVHHVPRVDCRAQRELAVRTVHRGGSLHHAGVAGLSEHRHDHRYHAGVRVAVAVHLLRWLAHRGVGDHDWARTKRRNAALRLAFGAGPARSRTTCHAAQRRCAKRCLPLGRLIGGVGAARQQISTYARACERKGRSAHRATAQRLRHVRLNGRCHRKGF